MFQRYAIGVRIGCFASFLMLVLCLLGSAGSASDLLPPLIPRKLLFGNPEKTSPKISSDGTKLAYLAPDSNDVLNVWVRDLVRGGEDRQVTFDKKRGVRQFDWQINGSDILYIQDKDGDEDWHLYQTNIDTKKTTELTPFEGVRAEILASDPRHPDELLILMNKRDPMLNDVYRLNLKTGDIVLDTENPGGVVGWLADHNLEVRVAQSIKDDGATLIRVRDDVKSPWRDWMTVPATEVGDVLDFSADNKSVYMLLTLESNTARLVKVDMKTKEETVLAEDPDYDITGVLLNPTTYALEAAGVEREKSDWIVLDPNLAGDFQFLANQFQGVVSFSSRDLANKKWIVAAVSDRNPTRFYVYERDGKKLQFLFTTRPDLEKYTLSPMKPVTFQARDGMKLHAYLTLPAGVPPQNLPAVLLVHGGPWTRDSWELNPTVQWLANRGYAVFQINYRGSVGFGKKYLNAGNREWAGKMHDDLLDGKDWLVKMGYVNPEKVAIMGGSYGGYATLVGLAFTPDAFCCGVDIVGPSNLVTLLQTLPAYWVPLKNIMKVRLGDLDTEQEFLKSRSPLYKADQIKKPLLIGQGANDPRVKQAESDQIVQAMRDKKIPVEYILFPDEGHGFARPENRLKFNAAVEQFLGKYLGGRVELPAPSENWESLKK